ncbi:MAG: molybdopterin-dependent oxidoreductase, partial [Candidatus Binataceae bacterium]
WTGVRLRDVLVRAQVANGARHVEFQGCDDPPNAADPRFVRSIALERAIDSTTLLAFAMNGRPLPPAHGGPLRLVVPGWTGQNWLKWIREIVVQGQPCDGHFMREYSAPARDGSASNAPICENRVRAIIARPLEGAVLAAGLITISGAALTGAGSVTAVEVSVNDGAWTRAELSAPQSPGAWQTWRFTLRAQPPGDYTLAVRATDSARDVQPETSAWNKGGYLWNGIERVTFSVRP